jgi:copper transporter 1
MNTCIVFSSWHITSKTLFTLSFFFIIGLGIFYEYLRIFTRQFDYNLAQTLKNDKSKGRIRLPSHEPSPERHGDDIGPSSSGHHSKKNSIG